MPSLPSVHADEANSTAHSTANQVSTWRANSGGPPRASASSRSLAVMRRSAESDFVEAIAVPTAAAVVTAKATRIIGRSIVPVRISLTATATLAIGTTAIAERSEMPGRNGASAGTTPHSISGKK